MVSEANCSRKSELCLNSNALSQLLLSLKTKKSPLPDSSSSLSSSAFFYLTFPLTLFPIHFVLFRLPFSSTLIFSCYRISFPHLFLYSPQTFAFSLFSSSSFPLLPSFFRLLPLILLSVIVSFLFF